MKKRLEGPIRWLRAALLVGTLHGTGRTAIIFSNYGFEYEYID